MKTLRVIPTDQEAFEAECFACWLNRIDARIDYEVRRKVSLAKWRALFDAGECEAGAIAALVW
jgi:hypothetical protein